MSDPKRFLSRIDLTGLYPPFARKLELLGAACAARGHEYWATCGLRTWEEQDGLYAIGRSTGKLGHFVTKAKGGESPHNFGVATDWTLDLDPTKDGLQPDYNDAHYKVLSEEAAKVGLESGGTWNSPWLDWPHVQYPVKQMGFSWADLRKLYHQGGLKAVYSALDKWQEKYGTI